MFSSRTKAIIRAYALTQARWRYGAKYPAVGYVVFHQPYPALHHANRPTWTVRVPVTVLHTHSTPELVDEFGAFRANFPISFDYRRASFGRPTSAETKDQRIRDFTWRRILWQRVDEQFTKLLGIDNAYDKIQRRVGRVKALDLTRIDPNDVITAFRSVQRDAMACRDYDTAKCADAKAAEWLTILLARPKRGIARERYRAFGSWEHLFSHFGVLRAVRAPAVSRKWRKCAKSLDKATIARCMPQAWDGDDVQPLSKIELANAMLKRHNVISSDYEFTNAAD